MKIMRRKKWAALLMSGAFLTQSGICLPEDYFALTARATFVTVVDSLVAAAIAPIFDSLGIPIDPTGTGE